MRTDEGDEILEPGDYELSDGRTLRVYLTKDLDEQVQMWACTHCQEADGVLNGLLVNVVDGRLDASQSPEGEFHFRTTQAGIDAVKAMLGDGEAGTK